MKAMVLHNFGGVGNLTMQECPIPTPGYGQVLIRIIASSINPIDIKTRVGLGSARIFHVAPPVILGWDLSGVVVSCGPHTAPWQVGDEVFGSINFPGLGQTNAQYALATAAHLARKPLSISHQEAAAASMAGLTAWQALTKHAQISSGQRVLIHAASGGVGHMAVQIAKSLGAYVIGTSSQSNKEFVLSLGADEHIDYKQAPFEELVHDIDFVFDAVGGETTYRSLAVIKDGGTLVTILPLEDDIMQAFTKRNIHIHFVLMESNSEDMEQISIRLADKIISVHISHQLSLAELGKAHDILETGRTVGKIGLTI